MASANLALLFACFSLRSRSKTFQFTFAGRVASQFFRPASQCCGRLCVRNLGTHLQRVDFCLNKTKYYPPRLCAAPGLTVGLSNYLFSVCDTFKQWFKRKVGV
jgi:hypothetical protein